MPGFKIEGMKELKKAIRKLGKLPQRTVTKAARSGAQIALRAAKSNAPVDTGALKGGIILKGEKRTRPGKKVYDIIIDPSKNVIFAKDSKQGKRSYYPASQEYGWVDENGKLHQGHHYLKRALTENAGEIENKVVSVLSAGVDKELGKG